MTTEIAILNRSGIALAADSAATVSQSDKERKIFNTANKVFSLSKYAPVGVMVFGSAQLMRIPWETLIKMYRHGLGKKSFPSLEEYIGHFFDWLEKTKCCKEAEDIYLQQITTMFLVGCRTEFDGIIKNVMEKNPLTSVTPEQVSKMLQEFVAKKFSDFKKLKRDVELSPEEEGALLAKYRGKMTASIKRFFENLPLTEKDIDELIAIIIIAACTCHENHSGIVIAGYGDENVYPSFAQYIITGVLCGKNVKRKMQADEIGSKTEAIIAPFAQNNDVYTFIYGIGPDLEKFMKSTLKGMVDDFSNKISDAIKSEIKLGVDKKDAIFKISQKMMDASIDIITKELDRVKSEKYSSPIIEATKFLEKNELAMMAETFVNMVSFRKQVTMASETVGGPIDVAVITKGDGFVWIKRKHYFNPELNHHFFKNYFGTENGDEKSSL
jgi:hypothetical protein